MYVYIEFNLHNGFPSGCPSVNTFPERINVFPKQSPQNKGVTGD
jgi:hypothetical protein